jgi:hypothetical protein
MQSQHNTTLCVRSDGYPEFKRSTELRDVHTYVNPTMTKEQQGEGVTDVASTLAGGSFGAVKVLMTFAGKYNLVHGRTIEEKEKPVTYAEAVEHLMEFDEAKLAIEGRPWALYKYVCQQDMSCVFIVMRALKLDLLDPQTVYCAVDLKRDPAAKHVLDIKGCLSDIRRSESWFLIGAEQQETS